MSRIAAVVLVGLVLACCVSRAEPETLADTIKSSPAVTAAVEQAKKELGIDSSTPSWRTSEPELLLLGGGCGVAGCSSVSLGSITVTRLSSNAPSRTILFAVSTHNGRQKKIALLSPDDARALGDIVQRALQ